jgi:hypothetical protein
VSWRYDLDTNTFRISACVNLAIFGGQAVSAADKSSLRPGKHHFR